MATSEQRELIPVDDAPRREPVGGALTDLRAGAMSLPVEQQQLALAEYAERRKSFREWLVAQLVEGVHYGFPPGLEPKKEERADGTYYGVWSGKKQQMVFHHERQWRPKPPLYAAGADYVCDLMGLREEYQADLDAWKQLGEPKGTFVLCCRLYSRETGALLSEGRGVRKTGEKGGDENNAIKMAQKSSKVSAVIGAYGLRDLFTQDMPPPPKGHHDNPSDDPDATPPPKSRTQRVTKDMLAALTAQWKEKGVGATQDDFKVWVLHLFDEPGAMEADPSLAEFDPTKQSTWNYDRYTVCVEALSRE